MRIYEKGVPADWLIICIFGHEYISGEKDISSGGYPADWNSDYRKPL
jgi:hypothetical protein